MRNRSVVAGFLPDVLNRVAPDVSRLNGGPEPVFTTQPSLENDIAIFNVALLLEQLENAFYNMNYPKFFTA